MTSRGKLALLAFLLVAVFGGGTALAAGSAADRAALEANSTFALGSEDAPLTVIEFASLTCPHCAHFDVTTFPEVKSRFIDTGKIRFVFRDFPLDGVALRAAMLVRCAGPEHGAAMIDLLFRSQGQWAVQDDPVAGLKQTVRLAGMGNDKADACLADNGLEKAVAQSRFDADRDYHISSTPSFAIGKNVVSGALSIEDFTKFLKDNGLPQ